MAKVVLDLYSWSGVKRTVDVCGFEAGRSEGGLEKESDGVGVGGAS